MHHPDWLCTTITQSASFWWEHEQFCDKLRQATGQHGPDWISVGDQETDDNYFHASVGLHQTTSQVDACRRVHEKLQENGYRSEFRMFSGGHDPASWRGDLQFALPWAFAQAAADEWGSAR